MESKRMGNYTACKLIKYERAQRRMRMSKQQKTKFTRLSLSENSEDLYQK